MDPNPSITIDGHHIPTNHIHHLDITTHPDRLAIHLTNGQRLTVLDTATNRWQLLLARHELAANTNHHDDTTDRDEHLALARHYRALLNADHRLRQSRAPLN